VCLGALRGVPLSWRGEGSSPSSRLLDSSKKSTARCMMASAFHLGQALLVKRLVGELQEDVEARLQQNLGARRHVGSQAPKLVEHGVRQAKAAAADVARQSAGWQNENEAFRSRRRRRSLRRGCRLLRAAGTFRRASRGDVARMRCGDRLVHTFATHTSRAGELWHGKLWRKKATTRLMSRTRRIFSLTFIFQEEFGWLPKRFEDSEENNNLARSQNR